MHLVNSTSTNWWKVVFCALIATMHSAMAPTAAIAEYGEFEVVPTLYGATCGSVDYFVCHGELPFSPESSKKVLFTENKNQSVLISPWEQAIMKDADHFALGIGAEKVPRDPFLLGEIQDSHYKDLTGGDYFNCGGNTAGTIYTSTKNLFYRIVFYKEPSRLRIREIVKREDRSTNLFISDDQADWPKASATLQEVLEKIELAKAGTKIVRRLAAVSRGGKAVGEVWYEPQPSDLLFSLYKRAAALETHEVRKHIYLGRAACTNYDWDEAWRQFECAYVLNKDDESIADEIALIYRIAHRDLERCIWLTRFLRVTEDWQRFELAYREKNIIEHCYYDEHIRNEKGPNIPWRPEDFPLKVFFRGSEKQDYDERLISFFKDAMAEWIVATEGRVDFEVTQDASKADIVCFWQEPEEKYKEYEGLDKAPQGVPYVSDIGTTHSYLVNGKPERAEIFMFARANGDHEVMEGSLLRALCLHEIGHALGIQIHLKNSSDNMYPYMVEEEPNDKLSERDKDCLHSLYINHPFIAHAVETYIGLHAECKKLEPESMVGTVSQASTK